MQGDLATLAAGFRTSVRSGQGLTHIAGRHAWLLRRAADRWMVVAVTWSAADDTS